VQDREEPDQPVRASTLSTLLQQRVGKPLVVGGDSGADERKKKTKKTKSSSSHKKRSKSTSSSSSSAESSDSSQLGEENKLVRVARKKPGLLFLTLMRSIQDQLARDRGLSALTLSPVLTQYYNLILKREGLGMRNDRELETLCHLADSLLRGQLPQVLDVIAQRLKAIRSTAGGEMSWSVARHLEIIQAPEMLSRKEKQYITKVEASDIRVKQALTQAGMKGGEKQEFSPGAPRVNDSHNRRRPTNRGRGGDPWQGQGERREDDGAEKRVRFEEPREGVHPERAPALRQKGGDKGGGKGDKGKGFGFGR
jgi:hypothetical protein